MELLARLNPPEAVQERRAPKEVVLRLSRGRSRKFERTYVIELCLDGLGCKHE
jgi:hypothetical protein